MGYDAAVLIDLENVIGIPLTEIIGRVQQTGLVKQPAIQRAYARFTIQSSKRITEVLDLGIDPITIVDPTKNAADRRLSQDAVEIAQQLPIRTFVIASDDGDFSPVVTKLRDEFGSVVVGCGSERASKALKSSCTRFVIIPRSGSEVRTLGHVPPLPGNQYVEDGSQLSGGAAADTTEQAGAQATPQRPTPLATRDEERQLIKEAQARLRNLSGGIGTKGLCLPYVVESLRNQMPDFDSRIKGICRPRRLIQLACRDTNLQLSQLIPGDYRLFAREDLQCQSQARIE